MKPKFLLYTDLRGIINCNTFSEVPSIINENAKNVLFHDLVGRNLIKFIDLFFFLCRLVVLATMLTSRG